MTIRPLAAGDRDGWLQMRQALWPELSIDLLAAEADEIIGNPAAATTLLAFADDGAAIGFAEVSIRDWAEGCETRPVGYLEAWYVAPHRRRSGVGAALLAAAERWARARGCAELGSDTELANELSQRAHRALGFREVVRLVLFSKRLAPERRD